MFMKNRTSTVTYFGVRAAMLSTRTDKFVPSLQDYSQDPSW